MCEREWCESVCERESGVNLCVRECVCERESGVSLCVCVCVCVCV